MNEIEVKSTKEQLKELKESMFWLDVQTELRRLRDELNKEYDLVGEPKTEFDGAQKLKTYPSTAETLIHLGDIKGRKKAIDYFLALPDIFLSLLESKNDERR